LILEKFEDLNFCKHISEDGQSSLSGISRHLSITTASDFMAHIETSLVRSLLVFTTKESNIDFVREILTKYKLLKVLDYESSPLFDPLEYLNFRHARVSNVPKSIGMLQNLETLDVRNTNVIELPKDTSKLR